MPTDHDKEYILHLEKRLAEADRLFRKMIGSPNPYIVIPVNEIRAFLYRTPLEPHPKPGRSGG